ncbi:hypothetical protein Fcan01_26967 [Folsomia candida]|uniref:Uncharacterized protein n=1 Tax=Folsomia candida TaxID=158441 RepID=A0A226CXW5_FOLCA|nr:hypothetical protein Fcan01_26967 [Folsomia candida]
MVTSQIYAYNTTCCTTIGIKSNYIKRNVISRSTHFLKITIDVALSKNFPSPKVNLDGGHDLRKRLTSLDPFIFCNDFSSLTDLKYGFDIILKRPTITISKLTATPAKKIKTGKGTTNVDITKIYKAKLSHTVTLATNIGIIGCLRTELCMADIICKFLYWRRDET